MRDLDHLVLVSAKNTDRSTQYPKLSKICPQSVLYDRGHCPTEDKGYCPIEDKG
jgi:hypothetical protein